MKNYSALRELPQPNTNSDQLKKGDYLVLFGELFARGYANGLVEAAEKKGLNIIRATVGRRTPEGDLRALTLEETQTENTSPLVNVPLEAGFDMEKVNGTSFLDLMKDVKLNDWEAFKADPKMLAQAHQQGTERFRKNTQAFVKEIEKIIPAGKNVAFAHLMAGGVPRARIIMPLMNKVFKGTGDRHMPSTQFWKSGLGEVTQKNFSAVTAETFDILLQETSAFRKSREATGNFCCYSAYGYHGTEVLMKGEYRWQSYAPYLQGWAKMELENFSRKWAGLGVKTAVYNCPEILTNSSSIFQGVEVPLYPLLSALEKQGGKDHPKVKKIKQDCQSLLKEGETLETVLETCQKTLNHPSVMAQSKFETWPDHNTAEQMEVLLTASQKIIDQHKDSKNLMTAVLSEGVFSACGEIMINDLSAPKSPVSWINHDIVAKALTKN